MNITTVTDPSEAAEVAAVAAVTFPLACPPHSTPENIAAHIAAQLSETRFAEYIVDEARDVLVARDEEHRVVGYALLIHANPTDADVIAAISDAEGGEAALESESITEVSKMYVLPDHHASRGQARPSHALMEASLDAARERGSHFIWLGVNSENERAQKYYRKMGFAQIGTKTFNMNGVVEHDHVMGRLIRP
ncbi:GNAT family N-acetyltransferase [Gordonia sp. PDNC005]|uniref:GNAT family N-acetyltransferase n=1 Tax=unclassified Gordonia (in: high G+C Gram-positive bacteria) TaxID=2657482 RepID=UPI001964A0EA|nr:GNAT family N-acetyltransferase [Gordonia sp. PDNC005]QRY63974.1 GNAT family N-acetyltransferase [Gordonia sp. PDNC005]